MLTKTQYIAAFEQMLLIRKFEEKCGQLYGMKLIGGFCHLYIGQEAVVAATFLAKNPHDSTITSYRDHGHIIASGTHPKYVLAELMGKETGCSKGKGGSMHLFNKQQHFYGGHGIVGAQIPIGTGLAFAAKYKGSSDISYTFLGDGAANQGQMFEAFNMAALWSLPVLYIIENNQYAMGTSVARSTFQTDLYKRGLSLGISGKQVDGMDLDKVYQVISQASDEIRSDSFPQIIEVKTYRYKGHSMSDPAKYRTKEEVESYKEHDPIDLLRNKVLAEKYLDENQIKEIEKKVKAIVQEAVHFAESSSQPNENQLYTDIYI
jgi:pyruvate dehydrogenase E1 component alpha subunit